MFLMVINQKMNRFKYYLFDLDGTLIDTKELIYLCFSKILWEYKKIKITKKEVDCYVGLPYRTQLEIYTGTLSDKDFYEMRNTHKNYQDLIYSDYISPCKGAIKTLKYLKENKIATSIVTSRNPDSVKKYLAAFDMLSVFSHIVTPLDTVNHKPSADPVLKALELMKAQPEEAVFIGDSIYDIESGNRAGVQTVYTSWANADFSKTEYQPDYIISDLEELL